MSTICLFEHSKRGKIPFLPVAAVLQSGDILLVLCPPTPPCGLSLIRSQPERKAADSREAKNAEID